MYASTSRLGLLVFKQSLTLGPPPAIPSAVLSSAAVDGLQLAAGPRMTCAAGRPVAFLLLRLQRAVEPLYVGDRGGGGRRIVRV